jgi:hypothetical protein
MAPYEAPRYSANSVNGEVGEDEDDDSRPTGEEPQIVN